MDLLHIALIVLVLAGAWALVELAAIFRRSRKVVDSLDATVGELNRTVEEARPIVSKFDGMVDDLQPAIAQVEPLLRRTNQAVEALTSDLVEVNGVLRDVSAVSGAAGAASNAVSGIADAASEKVSKLFGRTRKQEASAPATPALETTEADSASSVADGSEPAASGDDEPAGGAYYTYQSAEESTDE